MHKVFLPSDLQKSGGKAVIYCFADPLRRPAVYARKGLFRYPYKRILAFLIYKKPESLGFKGFGLCCLASPARFERAAFRLGGERSILLSYGEISVI